MCGSWSFINLVLQFIQEQIRIKCHGLGAGITEMGTIWLFSKQSPARQRRQSKRCLQWEATSPAGCTRGCGALRGAPPLLLGVRKGWVTALRDVQNEQVFVRWKWANINTVDALSPVKHVLPSSQQPYGGVTVRILQ